MNGKVETSKIQARNVVPIMTSVRSTLPSPNIVAIKLLWSIYGNVVEVNPAITIFEQQGTQIFSSKRDFTCKLYNYDTSLIKLFMVWRSRWYVGDNEREPYAHFMSEYFR